MKTDLIEQLELRWCKKVTKEAKKEKKEFEKHREVEDREISVNKEKEKEDLTKKVEIEREEDVVQRVKDNLLECLQVAMSAKSQR